MSDHEDVLRQQAETWERYGGFPEGASALRATLAELATLRSEVGILSAAKAGARYIAERDTLRQRLAEVEAQNRLLETWRAKHAKAPDLTPAPDPLQQGYCSGHCDHVRCRAAMSGGEIVLPESALAPVAEQPADARNLPAGTLVTCEHCSAPHPKDDDGTPCRYPKVADHV
jgi:hypothetical protein